MPSKQHPRRSPGRAHCVLNYPRNQQVVVVDVLEQVKQARQEVLQHYCADPLGVRGPQWTCSTALADSKYTRPMSDSLLANQLQPGSINPAFTRSPASEGWDISTELPSRRRLQQQLTASAAAALAGTARRRLGLLPPTYQPPAQREEAFALAQRQHKQAAADHAAQMLAKFGPDGAAAMAAIASMRRPDRPPVRIRTRREDVLAVASLPPMDSEAPPGSSSAEGDAAATAAPS